MVERWQKLGIINNYKFVYTIGHKSAGRLEYFIL